MKPGVAETTSRKEATFNTEKHTWDINLSLRDTASEDVNWVEAADSRVTVFTVLNLQFLMPIHRPVAEQVVEP
jgi:hypothetical protein